MKDLNSYVIDDDSCLRIRFSSSATDNLKVMRYARQKANCPYFRVMKAQKPYTVYRLELISSVFQHKESEEQLYRLVKIGVIE